MFWLISRGCPSTVTHKSYFTDENGYLILPNNLKIGRYRIEEVTAPNGYEVADAWQVQPGICGRKMRRIRIRIDD